MKKYFLAEKLELKTMKDIQKLKKQHIAEHAGHSGHHGSRIIKNNSSVSTPPGHPTFLPKNYQLQKTFQLKHAKLP